ncbi:AraC family transcriptional regulator [uncultured Shimia sp.]|uniref:helix-turn-helix domain-containing protein n=1 Tax=uncultured Shimia sp. TaxID=573152 RepID=UPI00260FA2A2|nr:AraC family transcriptional regulator [uncultured Shimia sp.]
MPQFTREAVGDKALDRALREAGLPYEFVEVQEGYIPKLALATFIGEVGRAFGDESIGLLWAPHLTIADYGAWGGYVLGAVTLQAALERAQEVMPYHSSHDRTFFRADGNLLGYEYRFSLKNHSAYPSIAFSALGAVLSIFSHYLGPTWRPSQIRIDLPRTKAHEHVETMFGCPVLWESDRLEIMFERPILATAVRNRNTSPVVLEDIKRERCHGAPSSFVEVVSQVLELQIATNGIALETAAQRLDLGPRALQRRLQSDGTNFRSLANQVKTKRAIEMLREGSLSVQDIAIDLGYENAQNFSRAFRKGTGMSPTQFAAL